MIGTKVYWDTGIFISLLAGDIQDDAVMASIRQQMKNFIGKKLTICTSVITIVEVLKSQVSSNSYDLFEQLIEKENFELVPTSIAIAQIAHDIRDYYSRVKDDVGVTVATPDAIHLATAVAQQCTTLYTFDAKDRPNKTRALIPLSRKVIEKYYLPEIKKPSLSDFQA